MEQLNGTTGPESDLGAPHIPTYLSHSYRPDDRELNEYFHDLCWDEGFAFTVDSPLRRLSTTRLEMMMRASAAFLAVVTRREDQPHYRCSPYMVYEHGLAVQAHKPRLVLLERNVSGSHFPQSQHTLVFDRNTLRRSRDEIRAKLRLLAAESRAYVNIGNRALGDVGLLLPATARHRAAAEVIRELLYEAGYTAVDLDLDDLDSARMATRLDRLDFVVGEIGDPDLAQQMAYLQGRFVPSIKLLHQPPTRPGASIPRLFLDRSLEMAGSAGEAVLRWSDPDQLRRELRERIGELSVSRSEFATKDEGTAYFRSLGQSRGPVFVSNAGADNGLARGIVDRLRGYNIRPFHYMYENSIRPGEFWKNELPRKVAESRVFVPLISQAYWKSDYCRQEFDTALELHRQRKLLMVPCFLGQSDGPEIEVHGISLVDLRDAERIERIVAYLDGELLVPGGPEAPPARQADRDGPLPRFGLEITIAPPPDYDDLYRRLRRPDQNDRG
jgi:hypothetical protein